MFGLRKSSGNIRSNPPSELKFVGDGLKMNVVETGHLRGSFVPATDVISPPDSRAVQGSFMSGFASPSNTRLEPTLATYCYLVITS
jgi:hypothetical protein